jgi:fructokinase
VRLNAKGVPDFNIVPDVAYDNLAYESEIEKLLSQDIRLIYYGTLIQRTENGASTLMKILENRPSHAKCFYDINLRPACYNEEIIKASLAHCDVLKLSEEESDVLKSMFSIRDDEAMIEHLRDEYSVEWVSLTKGGQGSKLYTPQGVHTSSVSENMKPADTVGAGDAYAAVLAIGYLFGWDPERIISQATAFAGAVCEIKGAIPDNSLFYQPFSDRIKGDTF